MDKCTVKVLVTAVKEEEEDQDTPAI